MAADNERHPSLVLHVRSCDEPFTLRRDGRPPPWADAPLHRAAHDADPELYALTALAEPLQPVQRMRVLFQLLSASRSGMETSRRRTLDRVAAYLLAVLDPDQVLTVFLAVRRVRANHKHTARAVLDFVLNHASLEDMAGCRRPALVDSLEHAMGKSVARACAKWLGDAEATKSRYVRRHLLRHAREPARAAEVFATLYRPTGRPAGDGRYRLTPEPVARAVPLAEIERPETVTPTNRGDIAATLVHLYRGGTSPDLEAALDRYVHAGADRLPRFDGKLALVLDASASTRGYGQREYATISQSVALELVLERCCAELDVHVVGGRGARPAPQGSTDLAGALVDALGGRPDLVAIVSDGYENVYDGDLARVVAALPRAGVHTPIAFCHSTFTDADDLTLRRPAPGAPQLAFWHEADFEPLVVALFSLAAPEVAGPALRRHFLAKLDSFEAALGAPAVLTEEDPS